MGRSSGLPPELARRCATVLESDVESGREVALYGRKARIVEMRCEYGNVEKREKMAGKKRS